MLILPHSVELSLPFGETGEYVYETIKAQVTPMTFNSAMSVTGAETRNPCMVITRPSNADRVKTGGRMRFRGKVFSVITDGMLYEGIGVADHVSFVVDQAEEGLDN